MKLTDRDMKTLRECWRRSEGRSWEPGDTKHPFFDRAIAAGYLRRIDGRCGFEAVKDSMISWTSEGRAALAAGANQ